VLKKIIAAQVIYLFSLRPSGGTMGKNPICSNEVAGVSVRDALEVVLMFWLGLPKRACRHNLRHDFARPKPRGIDVSNGVLGNPLLFF
jgi:hypothetical protein